MITLKGHTEACFCVKIMEDTKVISGSADGTIRVWDTVKQECDLISVRQ
jgi:WD40 repeat protein